MHLALTGTFDDFREQARPLLAAAVPPDDVTFHDASLESQEALFASTTTPAAPPLLNIPNRPPAIPKAFFKLATDVAWHSNPAKWPLLYRLAYRLSQGEPRLLGDAADPDVAAAERLRISVRRDAHKMHAFVRFNEVSDDQAPNGIRYVAFHKPEHRILTRETRFFVKRYPAQAWSILSPHDSIHWDTHRVTVGPGVDREHAPDDDGFTDLWLTYYAAVFNPARPNMRCMENEMPRKYWSTLPEARIIPDLLTQAGVRVNEMNQRAAPTVSAAPYVPDSLSLHVLREAAASCRGCDLCEPATQTVFGEGPPDAKLILLGEQPGDREDRAGRPFVGPAGQLLSDHLERAGLDRSLIYLTNTVKHFKFEHRAKRRYHKTPNAKEARACMPWFKAEVRAIQPALLVCLGATAARAVLGNDFRITRDRGVWQRSSYCDRTLATFHPSALLRNEGSRLDQMQAAFDADLTLVREALADVERASI